MIRDGFSSILRVSTKRNLTPVMELHHPLLKEFPEHREFIQWLKVSDPEFRRYRDYKIDELKAIKYKEHTYCI